MLVCWHDFAKRRGANMAFLIFEYGALNLACAIDASFYENLAVKPKSECARPSELLRRPCARYAHGRSQIGWFDKYVCATDRVNDSRVIKRDLSRQRSERHDGKASISCQPLCDVLVHSGRGSHHRGSDIRHVGELKCTLDRSIFTVRPVQHREHDANVGYGALLLAPSEPQQSPFPAGHQGERSPIL